VTEALVADTTALATAPPAAVVATLLARAVGSAAFKLEADLAGRTPTVFGAVAAVLALGVTADTVATARHLAATLAVGDAELHAAIIPRRAAA